MSMLIGGLEKFLHQIQGGAVAGEKEYQKIIIFFANFIQTLGEQLKLRQQVIATATVYFKRFYSQNTLNCVDPLLLAPTAIFLASKVKFNHTYRRKSVKHKYMPSVIKGNFTILG